jgi:putative transposase
VRPAPQEIRTYFVTAVTAQRRRIFQVTASADLFVKVLLDYRQQGRFLLHAFVVMPDHFHAIITPAPDISLEKAMQYIKGGFSFRLKSKLDVWMRSFNESQILNADKFHECLRYIEANPVRRGLASNPRDYPYSSAASGRPDPVPAHLQSQTARLALLIRREQGPSGPESIRGELSGVAPDLR